MKSLKINRSLITKGLLTLLLTCLFTFSLHADVNNNKSTILTGACSSLYFTMRETRCDLYDIYSIGIDSENLPQMVVTNDHVRPRNRIWQPNVSIDNQFVLYNKGYFRGPFGQGIWSFDKMTGNKQKLLPCSFQLDWHPSGDRFLYAKPTFHDMKLQEAFVTNINGNLEITATRLIFERNDKRFIGLRGATYSPDGNSIAFVCRTRDRCQRNTEIVVGSLTNSLPLTDDKLTSITTNHKDSMPQWTLDSQNIIWMRGNEMWMNDITGEGQEQLIMSVGDSCRAKVAITTPPKGYNGPYIAAVYDKSVGDILLVHSNGSYDVLDIGENNMVGSLSWGESHYNFNTNDYSITYIAGSNGLIEGTTSQIVKQGDDGTVVTAIPDEGYHFVNWSDGLTTLTRQEINVTSDLTFTANFAIGIPDYSITYIAGSNGSITGATSQIVKQGDDGTAVTAIPNEGYHFVNWSDDLTTLTRQETNLTSDLTFTANFAIDIPDYSITYIAGSNGSITGATSQIVKQGDDGTAVTAIPNEGYHFVNWSDGLTTLTRQEINVTSDLTFTANFAIGIPDYSITYTAGSNGSITGATSQIVKQGDDGTAVTAIPNEGYHFVNWSDGVTTQFRQEINVASDLTFTANFAIDIPDYSITYIAGSNGSITGVTSQIVKQGDDGTAVTAIPNEGYHFVNWSDGVTTQFRQEINVTSDLTFTAYFDSIEPTNSLRIISVSVPQAQSNYNYKTSLKAKGGTEPYTWTLINGTLPTGIELFENGDILGTPEEAGVFSFSVNVSDMNNLSASTSMVLTVSDILREATFITHSVVDAIAKQPYDISLLVVDPDEVNDWQFFADDSLPDGMELSSDGRLKGIPSTPGVYEMTIKAVSPMLSKSYNAQKGIVNNVTIEVVDTKDDFLTDGNFRNSKIVIDWKKRTSKNIENPDKLLFKMDFVTTDDFGMYGKKIAMNIGNYAIPLHVSKYQKNGKIIKFANSPLTKDMLNIKGKAKLNSKGVLSFMVKIKNANLSKVLGVKNKTGKNSQEYLPIEVIIGGSVVHSIMPIQSMGEENKKSILRLKK